MDGQKVELGRQREGQRWISVTAGAEVTISVTMIRVNRLIHWEIVRIEL